MTTFAAAAGDAVDVLGPAALRVLASGIDTGGSDLSLGQALPGHAELVTVVRAAQLGDGVAAGEAAAYLRGMADGYARSAAAERVEAVWSGPYHHTVPVRSTERALIDLVALAGDELWLMTYAATPHRPVLEALCAARSRGARVCVVVETLRGAGGMLRGSEPAAAFLTVPGVELWHRPAGRRPDGTARMHAKLAVADRRALLVSSANLTQAGVTTNIEAGLLVCGGAAPQRAAEHLDHLVAEGTLDRLVVGPR